MGQHLSEHDVCASLNQRVQGSSPCAPTNKINPLGQDVGLSNGRQGRFGNILGNILQSLTNSPPKGRASLCFSLSVGCENRLTAWGEVLQSGRTRNSATLGTSLATKSPQAGPLLNIQS